MNTRLSQAFRLLFISFLLVSSHCRPIAFEAERVSRGASPWDVVEEKTQPKEDQNKEENNEDTMFVFQDDIIISYEELMEIRGIDIENAVRSLPRARRNAGSGAEPVDMLSPPKVYNKLWPRCRVPYAIDQSMDSRFKESYLNAIMMWEQHTCIDFVNANMDDMNGDYLFLTKGERCKSFVGKQGGAQSVYLSKTCNSTGHAAHELGHAIGLWHEHSRPDRDEFVVYHDRNVYNKQERINFAIIDTNQFKEMPFIRYDIQSIMHYSPFTSSISLEPGKETLTLREDADIPELNCTNRLEMGQREKLSYLDNKRLSALYDCKFDMEEPQCVQPTPSATTPPEDVTTTESVLPTPTTTAEALTAPPLENKLSTGNVIVLKFGDTYGIECTPTPGCTPLQQPCRNLGGDTCAGSKSQFQIINHPSISSPKIRSGNTVLLRSVDSKSHWLDCSNFGRCVISECREDYVEDPGNDSYISNCSYHQFKVYGVGRDERSRLKTNHRLSFKYSDSVTSKDGYLNCNGNKCNLLGETECPKSPLPLASLSSTTCKPEGFKVEKLYE